MPESQVALYGASLPLPPLRRAHSDSGDIFAGERLRGIPWTSKPCACCGGTRAKLPTKASCIVPNTKENTFDGSRDFWRSRSYYLECELRRETAENAKLLGRLVDLAGKINELNAKLKEKEAAHNLLKKTSQEKAEEGNSTIAKLQNQLTDIKTKLELVHQECSLLTKNPDLPSQLGNFSETSSDKTNKKSGDVSKPSPGRLNRESDHEPLSVLEKYHGSISSANEKNGFSIDSRVSKAECYLLALEDSPVVVAHTDLQLRYTWTSNFSLYGQKEVLGKRDYDILPPGTSGIEEAIELKQRAISTGQLQKGEIQWRATGKDPVVWVLTARPLRDKKGKVIGVSIVAMDVTQETLFRERLMVLRAEMMIRKATEKELQRARRMAEEAKSSKSMFLAIMSHEIRTPLNGMLGLAQALLESPMSVEQKELVKGMMASGNIMSDILSDLLDLASVERGTMKLNESAYSPSVVVDQVMEMAACLTRDKNIEVEADIAPNVPSQVWGDESKIRQVLKCLVLNAVKFTEKGYIKVRLTLVDYDPAACSDSYPANNASYSRTNSDGGISTSSLLHLSTVTEDHLKKLAGLGNLELIAPLLAGIPTDASVPEGSLLSAYPDELSDGDFWKGSTSQSLSRGGSMDSSSGGAAVPSSSASSQSKPPPKKDKASGNRFRSGKSKGGSWLFLEVSDSGVGIPEEAFAMLFEKFTQVSCGPTRNYGGTGLGLAISKQLVELMGGHLTVSSKVNHGSTFSFSIRCKSPSEVNSNASSHEGSPNIIQNMMEKPPLPSNLSLSVDGSHEFTFGNGPPIIESPSPSTFKSLPHQNFVPDNKRNKPMGNARSGSPREETDDGSDSSLDMSKGTLIRNPTVGHGARNDQTDLDMDRDGEGGESISVPKNKFRRNRVIRGIGRGMQEKISEEGEGEEEEKTSPQRNKVIPRTKTHEGVPRRFPWKRVEDKGECDDGDDSNSKAESTQEENRVPLLRDQKGKPPLQKEPRIKEDREGEPHKAGASKPPTQASTSTLPKILLAEDNKVNVMVASSMLKRLGLKATVASNGVQAMEAIKKEKFDILLLDICMPLMDGLQTAFLIRQYEETGVFPEEEVQRARDSNAPAGDEKQASTWKIPEGGVQSFSVSSKSRPRLPIVAVTANALASDQERCFAVGMDAFIAKPIIFQTLKDTMSRFITLPTTASSVQKLRPKSTSKSSTAGADSESFDKGDNSSEVPSIPITATPSIAPSMTSFMSYESSLMLKSMDGGSEYGSEFGKSMFNESVAPGAVIMSPKSPFNEDDPASADTPDPPPHPEKMYRNEKSINMDSGGKGSIAKSRSNLAGSRSAVINASGKSNSSPSSSVSMSTNSVSDASNMDSSSVTNKNTNKKDKNIANGDMDIPPAASLVTNPKYNPIYNSTRTNISPLRSRLEHANSLPARAISELAGSNKFQPSFKPPSSLMPGPSELPSSSIPSLNSLHRPPSPALPPSDSLPPKLNTRNNNAYDYTQEQEPQQQLLQRQQQNPQMQQPQQQKQRYKPFSSPLSSVPQSPNSQSSNKPKVQVSFSRSSGRPSKYDMPEAMMRDTHARRDRRLSMTGYDSSSSSSIADSNSSFGRRPMASASIRGKWKTAVQTNKFPDRIVEGDDRMAALISTRLERLQSKHSQLNPQQLLRTTFNEYDNFAHRSMFQ